MFLRIVIFAVGIISALSKPIYVERRTSDSDYATCKHFGVSLWGLIIVIDSLDYEQSLFSSAQGKLSDENTGVTAKIAYRVEQAWLV